MKKIITLSMLLFCGTMFAPGNFQPNRLDESTLIVTNPNACCKISYCIYYCALCCVYCCGPRFWTDSTTPSRTKQPQSQKME